MIPPASSSSASLPHIAGYTLFEEIYSGSRTCVYRGWDNQTQGRVVIKLLRRGYPSFEELVQFRNQYAITRNLPIPGIIKPVSLLSVGNGYALVMEDWVEELGDGIYPVALNRYLRENGSLPVGEVLEIGMQLTDILHGLGQCRVIHKDIKPGNILIHPVTKQVRLIDFSIASLLPKDCQEIQSPNVLEGTLAYLAPEQTGRMNRGIDYRTDFYSLGVTLYELLTGRLPFVCDDPLELVHCHIAKIPPAMSNGEIPGVVDGIIHKLMAKNAEDRYQSALGLKYDLEKCLNELRETGTIKSFPIGQRDICDRFIIPEKLYGREREVGELLTVFARVSQGSCELMLVAGFSGIGKTAVVNEVHKPIVKQRGYFIKGKFDQFNRDIPFSAFVQALRDLMTQLLSESDAQLARWRKEILAAVGENGQVLIEVIPELEAIIGSQPPVAELSGSALQNRFQVVFQRFISVFTTPDHPLVIFLDDLQWVDAASLELLKLLMDSHGYLLILAAYRDNEVSPIHPFILTVGELKKSQVMVNGITLTPLKFADVNDLVADTLHCPGELAQPLTELIFRKTQGNPFFTTQFLKALQEDGYIRFNIQRGYWECDITQVNALSLTNDVVEFMTWQLQKLPPQTQRVLKFAACVGNQFDLETLGVICEETATEVATALWKALQEGLILPTTQVYKFFQDIDSVAAEIPNPQYRFLHDRVQQAAYCLIPEGEKQTTHLQIGQLLQRNLSDSVREEKLFEIVGHWNLAADLITDLQERENLVRLNLAAGKKARNSAAYASARNFFQTGIKLLSGDCWDNQYELTLDLYISAAESAYLNADIAEMELMANQVLNSARTPLDRVKIYEIQINVLTAQGRMLEAIATGRDILAQLGVEFATTSDQSLLNQILQTLSQQLHGKQVEELANLPLMEEPRVIAAIDILSKLFPPTIQGAPHLLPLLALTMVNLSVQFGNTYLSVVGYVLYGLVLSAFNREVETGYRFGKLALTLLERFHQKTASAAVLSIFGFFIQHHKEHLRTTISIFQQGYQAGMETGDFVYVSYNILSYFDCKLFAGVELDSWYGEIAAYQQVLREVKQDLALAHLGMRVQTANNLLHLVKQPDCLRGEAYDETVMIPKSRQNQELTAIAFVYTFKLYLAYLWGNYSAAVEYITQVQQYIQAISGMVFVPVFHCYAALTYLGMILEHPPTDFEEILGKVESHAEALAEWAKHAPMNHQHKLDLVTAQKSWILGEKAAAIELYDKAIAGAKANAYLHEEALANELAAKFYLDWGKEKIAADYMQQAYYCYARWGAKAKIYHLEHNYPQLLIPILQSQAVSISATETVLSTNTLSQVSGRLTGEDTLYPSTSASSSISATLDLTTVLKVSQILSQEIELDRLLATLLQTVFKNAGADRGVLLMFQDGQWFVEATATLDTSPEIASIPLDNYPHIPHSLIHRVKRTSQPVVIDNVQLDVNLQQQIPHPPKSVLCTPLCQQGELVGILYLENHAAIGAFTSDRVQLINFLCTQAAISLKNARLYQTLQQKELFLRSIYEGVNEGICVIDVTESGDFLYAGWNPSLDRLVGISSCDVAGKTPEEVFGVVQGGILRQNYQSCLNCATTISYEEFIPIQGQDFWWFTTLNPLQDDTGRIHRIILTTIEISDRKQAEIALQASQSQLQNLANNIPGVISRYQTDTQGKTICLYISDRSTDIFGFPPAQIQASEDCIFRHIDPADQESFQIAVTQSIQTLQPLIWSGRYNLPTGEQKWIESNFIPTPQADGSVIWDGFTLDITQRKIAEREQQKLLTIINATSDIVGIADAQGNNLYINPAGQTLFGLTDPQAEFNIATVHPPHIHEKMFHQAIPTAIQQGIWMGESMIVNSQGEEIPISQSIMVHKDPSGNVEYFSTIIRDIRDIKIAEKLIQEKNQVLEQTLIQLQKSQAQVVQSEKMSALGNLVAGVAHEINNPIGFINGSINNGKDYVQDLLSHLDLYQQYYPQPVTAISDHAEDIDLEFLREDLPKLLDGMKAASDRIKSISTSLRTFSRADTENKIAANIHEGMDSTLLILKYRLKGNENRPAIEVIQNYGNIPAILCFPGQLNQVFMNILANAIDVFDEAAQESTFTELKAKPQQITIQTTLINPNQIQIRIRDNGKGMSPETQARIFDHLFTTKAVGKGTGLGLAIARQIIVDKHNGTIEVRSQLGKGTEFCICLPVNG
ncbi:AAA family ATPase [Calothrix sp. NIES-3974]|uniref:AAA family ATPase n=1 Tax=Calothrix sp. NIES-3974 TaxID=2005462 RepID=UPI000B61D948|nr:AAA family ATPase [Calothrix sp. NIES-3974]BAZ04741.1 serine/threonine protein kinase with two-component sensor domain [Calothrix sp. NIES-3974]